MKYRDEIHIAMMALVFSCAMFAIYAVVPKDAVVAAKARSTGKGKEKNAISHCHNFVTFLCPYR